MLFNRPKAQSPEPRGQALVEFAIVLPLLILIVLGIMQFGLLFWTQITVTQITRDTGRWAATQPGCDSATVPVATEANDVAARSSLYAYGGTLQTVGSAWFMDNGTTSVTTGPNCPPEDNSEVRYVEINISHQVPVFLPMLADNGCAGSCMRSLSSEVRYRLEPLP